MTSRPTCPRCKHPILDEEVCDYCGYPGDEPPRAGQDPYGRPDPLTHPEYWTE